MTERVLGLVLLVCACLSGLVLWAVQSNLSNTQVTVTTDTSGALNFLVQSSHTLDQFTDAVRELQLHDQESTLSRSEAEELVRSRYDIVWATFSIFNAQFKFPDTDSTLQGTKNFNGKSQQFLNDTQPLVDSNQSLGTDHLSALVISSREMLSETHKLARSYFVEATKRQNAVTNHIKILSGYMRLFIAMVLLTGGLGVGLLIRSNIRTNSLFKEAQEARTELAYTVEELRSGRREQKAKDSFIVSANHDLRQPLHALGLFLNSLTHNVRPDGQKALQQATGCVDDLNKMFNSLLDLSKLDAGVVTVAVVSFELHEILSKVHSQVQPIALAKDISVTLALNDKETYAKTDPLLLGRIVCNLVDNAVTHSGATRVSISSKSVRNGHEICITDNGKGIAKDQHAAIFSEYYQIENPERDRAKGLGLGLSIVKRLSQLLDLEVKLESTLGAGSRFTMIVPAGSNAHVLPTATNASKVSQLENVTGAVIVVIDDDSSILEAMNAMLTNLGLVPVCTETIDSALNELAERDLEPHLIVADYRLRNHLTGNEAIRQMREAIDEDIPGIIVTGDTSPARVSELAATGFAILHKPVDAKTLQQKIGEALTQGEPA